MDKYKAQRKYDKENTKMITVKYKKEFVNEFNDACKKLGLVKSQVIKKAMEDIIKKAQKKD